VVGPAQRLSRPRLETRAGTVELRIPKLRKGSYFPGFLEPRRMAGEKMAENFNEFNEAGGGRGTGIQHSPRNRE
jgi:hypothetical protein